MRQVLIAAVIATLSTGAAFAQSSGQQSLSESASAPPYALATPAQQQEVQQNLKDVHFDFDRYDLRPDDQQALQQSANWLKANPDVYVTIAGEADDRGSISYNLYLSDERAKVTRDALVQMGVPADRIVFATGWGELYPVCTQSDESCWAQNRRAHFEPWQAGSVAASKNTSRGTELARTASIPSK